jgi:antitoxin (DNA-binding transcriptional repressor) of toxin-antitoxin stability system
MTRVKSKPNRVSKSQFKARALEFFRQVETTGEPLIVTDHGEPNSRSAATRRRFAIRSTRSALLCCVTTDQQIPSATTIGMPNSDLARHTCIGLVGQRRPNVSSRHERDGGTARRRDRNIIDYRLGNSHVDKARSPIALDRCHDMASRDPTDRKRRTCRPRQ